jgi:hypothetical protein
MVLVSTSLVFRRAEESIEIKFRPTLYLREFILLTFSKSDVDLRCPLIIPGRYDQHKTTARRNEAMSIAGMLQ